MNPEKFNRKYLLPTNNGKWCDLCNKNNKTGNFKYKKVTCPLLNCDKARSHYHKLCMRCCDAVNFKKLREINFTTKNID
jgi:hypothetical protein